MWNGYTNPKTKQNKTILQWNRRRIWVVYKYKHQPHGYLCRVEMSNLLRHSRYYMTPDKPVRLSVPRSSILSGTFLRDNSRGDNQNDICSDHCFSQQTFHISDRRIFRLSDYINKTNYSTPVLFCAWNLLFFYFVTEKQIGFIPVKEISTRFWTLFLRGFLYSRSNEWDLEHTKNG